MATASNEPDAERWLKEHGDVLYRYALRHTGEPWAAEDLVQETLLAAWRDRARFRGESAERTWLIGILKHKLVDETRRRRRAAETLQSGKDDDDIEARFFKANGRWRESPGEWGRDPLDHARSQAFLETLVQCLEGVPDAQRESFMLREFDGLGVQATGELMGVSTNNLYVLLHRARLRLRACLEARWFAGQTSQ